MSKKIPERIFIQQFEDPEIEGFQEDDGATWWTSKVHEHDIEYIHIKEYEKLEAKVKDLEKELSSERSSRDADCMVSDMYKDHNDQLEKELAALREANIEYVRVDHVTDASKKVAALREAIDLAVKDLQLALTEQLPYDEICNDLHQLFEEILKSSKGGE